MPLTPADIRNVAFSKPLLGKRGYNEDEVDTFLDLIGAELARLIEQNNDLKRQVEQRDRKLHAAGDPGRDLRPVQQVSTRWTHDTQAAKVLGLAQQIADRLTADAKVEATGMLRDARTRSELLLADARTKSDGLVNEARTRAEALLNSAHAQVEALDRQSQEKVAALERDAAQKHGKIIGSISQEKSVLEKKVDELRTVEREYRKRLKAYLESQLRELDLRACVAPADTARNQQDGFSVAAEHRTDPEIGRTGADVARLPNRSGPISTETIGEAGTHHLQWEPAV
jgi:DivIVA domain-containing protein